VPAADLELGVWFNAEAIIHGLPEPLFASQVFFRRLHRYMTKQELNLLQFAP
jgi:hypothetical protein